jgi:hypothetical protein
MESQARKKKRGIALTTYAMTAKEFQKHSERSQAPLVTGVISR